MLVDLSRVSLVLRLVVQGTLSIVGFLVPIVALESCLVSLHGPALCSCSDLLLFFEVGTDSRHSRTDSDGQVNRPFILFGGNENQFWLGFVTIVRSVMARSRNELLPIGSLRENTNFV